jgi:hypothetical protein
MDSYDIRRDLRVQLALMDTIGNDLDQLTQAINQEEPGDIRQAHIDALKALARRMLAVFNRLGELNRALKDLSVPANFFHRLDQLVSGMPNAVKDIKGGIDDAMRMRHDFDATLVQAVVDAMRACQGWLNMMRTMFNLSQHLNII